mgnify:FL=1
MKTCLILEFGYHTVVLVDVLVSSVVVAVVAAVISAVVVAVVISAVAVVLAVVLVSSVVVAVVISAVAVVLAVVVLIRVPVSFRVVLVVVRVLSFQFLAVSPFHVLFDYSLVQFSSVVSLASPPAAAAIPAVISRYRRVLAYQTLVFLT